MRSLAPLSLLLFALTGCYRYVPMERLSVQPVPGSERVVDREQSLAVVRSPTRDFPVVSFALTEVSGLTRAVRPVFRAGRVQRSNANLLGGLLLWGLSGAVMYQAQFHVEPGADSVLTAGGVAVVLTSLGLFAGGFGLIKLADVDAAPVPVSGRTILGPAYQEAIEPVSRPLAGVEVTVTVESVTRLYVTGDSGVVNVDLVRDFLLSSFDTPRQVMVSASSVGYSGVLSTSYDTRTWTAPCVTTTGSGVVRAATDGASTLLGDFAAGRTLWVEDDENGAWVGVSFEGRVGWVSRVLTKRCWASPIS